MTWLLVAFAGGLGAVLRHLVHEAGERAGRGGLPTTLAVNTVGSFALGLVTGVAGALDAEVVRVLSTGLLGGFTTFSTVSADCAERWLDGRRASAVAWTLGMLVTCLTAAALGLWLGATLAAR